MAASIITKAVLKSNSQFCLNSALKCVSCNAQQVRHKGAQRYSAPPVPKDKQWIMRSKRSTVKAKVMPKNWEEKFMSRVPVDDVWMRAFYPKPSYTFEEALTMHQDAASPDMFDNKDGPVYIHLSLDMKTKKKTKFMGNIKKTLVLPHSFEDGTENRVLVFCKTEEETEKAQELGALYAGNYDIIKSIEKGEIKISDIDHVVCMVDVLVDLAVIRKQLRTHFPSYNNGNLGNNLEELVTHFVRGKSYESKKTSEDTAELKLQVGKMDMSSQEIIDNFNTYIEAVCSHKSADLGPFVKEAYVSCPPSQEKFQLTQKSCNKPPAKKARKVNNKADDIEQDIEEVEDEKMAATS